MSALPDRIPTITMDRAVGQYYESVDIDFAAVQEFYDSLDIAEKPPLEDCLIHFSSLAKMEGGVTLEGGHTQHELNEHKYLGESVPQHHVLAFLGSTLLLKDGVIDSDGSFTDSTVLAHELVHYGQNEAKDTATIQEELKAMKKVIRTSKLVENNLRIADFAAFTVGGFVVGLEATSNALVALATGVAAGGIMQQMNHKFGAKRRQRKHEKALRKYNELCRSHEHEEEAYEHQETILELVEAVPRAKQDRPSVLIYDMLTPSKESMAIIKTHDDACYGEPLPIV